MADLMSIGTSALRLTQLQLATTGHNISNVSTPGYSRQTVLQESRDPQFIGAGFIGKGVTATTVRRSAEDFLIDQLHSATTGAGRAEAYLDLAGRVDRLLGDNTFAPALQNFFSALNDANTDPASPTSRQVLLSQARGLADAFNSLERELGAAASDVNRIIEDSVSQINALARSIAGLNRDIVLATGAAQGAPPNDLLDQRDRVLQELAQRVGYSTVEQDDGAINVFVGGGQLLVNASTPLELTAFQNPLDASRLEVGAIVPGGINDISTLVATGELGGTLAFREEVLDEARNGIGRLAAALVLTVNEAHRNGMDLDGNLGQDLFTLGSPQVGGAAANVGTIAVTLDASAPQALTTSDYRLTHDGSAFTVTRLNDGSQQTLSGAGPFTVDGFTIAVTAPPVAGDQYLIQPTKNLPRALRLAVSDGDALALASPVRTRADAANLGDGRISAGSVLDVTDPDLLTATTLVFNDPPTTYQVNGAGPSIAYVSGADIDLNGWRVQLSGSPEPGDLFAVGTNNGGRGDNANGLLLADLQGTGVIDGGTANYQTAFGSLVGTVGARTQQTQFSRDALVSLRDNAQAARDEVSGVSLDEEAAQLLKFQQAYQAAAQMIAIAGENFDSLLAAVRS